MTWPLTSSHIFARKSGRGSYQVSNSYYLSTDDAYMSGDQHVVPFGGKNLAPWQGNYNHYQPSQRTVVECALGVVQARWGVPKRAEVPGGQTDTKRALTPP